MRRIAAGEVTGEAAHRLQTFRPDAAVRVEIRVTHEPDRDVEGDGFGADRLEVGDEPSQLPFGVGELVSQRTSQCQIIVECFGEGAHRVTGHAGASSRRAA